MHLRTAVLSALLLAAPVAAAAQDFGIVESAETINHRNFKIRGNPMIVFGKNGENTRTGAAIVVGYGFTPSFDAEGGVAIYDGLTFFGGNGEWWIVKENPIDFSIAAGLHGRTGSQTRNLTGVDLTFLPSGHVSKRLELYGGLDFAFEGVGQSGGYKTIHFVPGIEYKINESLDLDAEFGIALNDAARHYAAIALAFYLR